MSEEPLIGLVTVLYKSEGVLSGFFESLRNQTYSNMRLYVIDNSPDEKSANLAKEFSTTLAMPVLFLINRDNPGIATGNNQGIKLALNDSCDHVLLLNNDIEFAPDTISNMVSRTRQMKESIVVPKILYYDAPVLWFAGGYLSWLLATGVHRGNLQNDLHQYDIEQHVTYAPTCFMLIKSEVFLKTGLMDESYFVYYDDTDFVFRALKHYYIFYCPSSVVLHKVGSSSGGTSEDKLVLRFGRKSMRMPYKRLATTGYLLFRNQAYYIHKNYPPFIRLFITSIAVIKSFIGIVVYDDSRLKRMSILIKATRDGIKGVMGNPFGLFVGSNR